MKTRHSRNIPTKTSLFHKHSLGKERKNILNFHTFVFVSISFELVKKILKLNLQSYSSSDHLPRWKGKPYWWRKSSASWPTRRSCTLQVASSGWTAPWSGCWWRHLCRRGRSNNIVGVNMWKRLQRRLLEERLLVDYLALSQNSRWKQTRTPCSGREPQDWHSGRNTGREIAVYDCDIHLLESHMNVSHFVWSFAFLFSQLQRVLTWKVRVSVNKRQQTLISV